MQLHEWLASAEHQLGLAGVSSSRLDALLLLERATGRDRAWLLAHPETELSDDQAAQLSGELTRRLVHEPMGYILGRKEFYGREFYVDSAVLEPRPESEAMIDLLKLLAPTDASVADIGTGSGALAITAALETGAAVTATDIDAACLAVAERNALLHKVTLDYFQGNLLEPFLQRSCKFIPDILLANLPYVPDLYPINKAASHEPELALFGGSDGLDFYRQLFEQTRTMKQPPRLVLTEALADQHEALAQVALTNQYELIDSSDLIQAFRPQPH